MQLVATTIGNVLLVANLLALVWRRRIPLACSFFAYIAAVTTCEYLISYAPARFNVREFWIVRQAAYDILKVAVALELGWRTFQAYPGARRAARIVFVGALLLVLAVMVDLPLDRAGEFRFLTWPKGSVAAIWLMSITLFLAIWFRIPLHPFRLAILEGFVPYLFIFSTIMGRLRPRLVLDGKTLNLLDTVAYTALLAWWLWAATRPDPGPATEEKRTA